MNKKTAQQVSLSGPRPREALVPRPPLGWNSYDCFGMLATEGDIKANADYMAEHLKNYGWEYIVLDYLWSADYLTSLNVREKNPVQNIDSYGRPIVLSLSPGPTPLAQAKHVRGYADLWRISGDLWDEWPKVLKQFELCRGWAAHIEAGHWPDADMLPLGKLSVRTDLKDQETRRSRLTKDEQITVMSLWSIFRSPLMFGGNMPDNDEFTLALLTNEEVLAVDQNSIHNKELRAKDGLTVWTADVPNSRDKYIALFNTRDAGPTEVVAAWAELGLAGTHDVRDLWARQDLGAFKDKFSAQIPAHDAGLYRIKVR